MAFRDIKQSVFFAGYKWVDKSWGTIPIWSRKDVKEELVIKIRDEIKKGLVNLRL